MAHDPQRAGKSKGFKADKTWSSLDRLPESAGGINNNQKQTLSNENHNQKNHCPRFKLLTQTHFVHPSFKPAAVQSLL